MESIESKSGFLARLNRRLKGTGDSEPEQAKLRLAIGFVVMLYLCLPWAADQTFNETILSPASLIVLLFYTLAMIIFAAIIIHPVASQFRRVCGSTLDLGSMSILMFYSGSESVPLFLIYLWVILGNGFRFGLANLYISQAISIVGFSIVVGWGEFWVENRSFGISLFLMLCLLPLYAAFLIKKLHAAVDMAKQANLAKSRFLANMSHELRTPLNGVIGMGDLLRETKLNLEQQELVRTMHSSANTLLELIENVLDIAKIEAGKTLIEHKEFDLHKMVNSVIFMLARQGENKGITVACNFDPSTAFALKGDQQHIRQVLINLISNAIKFTHEGSVILYVRTVGGSVSKPVIRFEIVDTGIGIPAEAIESIFDDFIQADSSTSRSYGGTGLGTTISKELVELMDGEIGLKSELGKGSTFWFELPFSTADSTPTDISDNHVLLLASEETSATIRPALKGWEIKFDWVRTTSRAISQLIQASDEDSPYETIIVDQSCLIDINAVHFAQMVKSEGLLEHTSLILINSSDTMIDANRSNHYYISTIENPEDKRSVFNALHAAQSVNYDDNKVVGMAEHYANQAGAKSLNILVAEDNKVNQQVINGILGNAGHNVLMVNTGTAALDKLTNDLENIDMLIVDMNMPEVSGLEVIKTLRFMDTSNKIPAIMLTADATPQAREESVKAGANQFLTKPIDAGGLLESIAALSRKTQKRATKDRKTVTPQQTIVSNFAESEWYDYTVIHELDILGGDPDFIKSLVNNFEKEGLQHILELKRAFHDDFLEYREHLHALKGSSTELGAAKLVDICEEGEAFKPYDIGSEKMERVCEQIEDKFNKTVTALKRAVTGNADSNPVISRVDTD